MPKKTRFKGLSNVLKNISRVVNPGGAIYIIGSILDNSRTSPPDVVVLNLVYMNLCDEGQAYTEQEHRDWLAEAGFEGFERIDVPQRRVIITARKPR